MSLSTFDIYHNGVMFQIVLQNVTKQASGTYSCEVSADQPNFSTGSKTFYLQVSYNLFTEFKCRSVIAIIDFVNQF